VRSAEGLHGGGGVVQGELADQPLPAQRRAQFVRGVGDELALGAERRLQPGEKPVEGVAEFLDLVVGPVKGEALVQAAGGDPLGGGGDRAQRARCAAGRVSRSRVAPGGGAQIRSIWRATTSRGARLGDDRTCVLR
jgi:hypothetical protein